MESTLPNQPATASFWILAILTFFGAVTASIVAPPTDVAMPAAAPLIFILGAYFALCPTFFQDFPLYRLKIARAVDWYGEDFTHVAYRVLGFAAMGVGLWTSTALI